MRRNLLSASIPLAVALVSGAGASAAVLTTGAFEVGGSTASFSCAVVNVSKKPLDVVVEGVGGGGTVIFSNPFSLAANGGIAIASNSEMAAHSCRFSFPGGAKRVRASMIATDSTGGVVAIDAAR